MSTPQELKFIVEKLVQAPFSKTWSVIQIHDEIPEQMLLQTLLDVLQYTNEQDALSPFKKVDYREVNDELLYKIIDFLKMLKFKEIEDPLDWMDLGQNRQKLLKALYFLLSDLPSHKKRAYLAIFLSVPPVPVDFAHDDVIVQLGKEIENMQEQFKQSHKYLESIKDSGLNAGTLKREIQQMEEEKHQVIAKIQRLKKKVEHMAKKDQWLEGAKNLRLQQSKEMDLLERLREQRLQLQESDKRAQKVSELLKEVKHIVSSSTPESLFTKIEEENKMNRFLALETLPKRREAMVNKIKDLTFILSEPAMSEKDLAKIETEIANLNKSSAALAEEKMKQSASGDANLALFRQQAAIISRKKESTLDVLNRTTEELKKVQEEAQSKRDTIGQKMLKGDDFKRYVSELRGKSTLYKRKKAELSGLMVENGILSRTVDILKQQHDELKAKLGNLEQEQGIAGFHDAQETLEFVSEKKSQIDQEKGATLEQVSKIVEQLMETINQKKNLLAPVIAELRTLRQQHQDLETAYGEKKRQYDAAVLGMDSDMQQLEEQVKNLSSEIYQNQTKYHLLNTLLKQIEIHQDRVMGEMKAYIGGDEMTELVQKTRGFKTYRDLYTKKTLELEHMALKLRETQKMVKEKHEPNMKQIQMFKGLSKLLKLKVEQNQKIISGETDDKVIVTHDRLVLV
ncbi:hypothetical protein EDD86DRAFT_211793 [Gorgonomyces haynaldii]|nr:hypothetical protein EDD86DRAFT_211793 [Gorgonomyces haynaldii]